MTLGCGRQTASIYTEVNPWLNLQLPSQHWWLTSVILATHKVKIGRIKFQGYSQANVHETPILKITRAKQIGGVAQAVEHLLCQCKALSSNSIPTKNKSPSNFI
jgi:hypothetical protein